MIFEDTPLTLDRLLWRRDCAFQRLIAATYTVDCQRLLSLADAVYQAASFRGEEKEGTSLTDLCLEYGAVAACARERLALYSHFPPDDGGAPPVLYENAVALYAACGRQMGGGGRTFHPKLLLAVFSERGTGRPFFHLEVGSRNLTASSGLELSVYLEGVPAAEEAPNGGELAEFFRCAGIELPPELDASLRGTRFQIPAGSGPQVSDVAFAYQAPERRGTVLQRLQEDLACRPPCPTGPEGRRAIQAWSPFLLPDQDGRFYLDVLGDVDHHTVLTRSLLAAGRGRGWSNVYAATREAPFYHGKLLLWPLGQRELPDGQWEDALRIWLGSANASKNGMERNIELMVGLTLRAVHSGSRRRIWYSELFDGRERPRSLRRLTGSSSVSAADFLPFSDDWGEDRCRPEDPSPLLRIYLSRLVLAVSQGSGGSLVLSLAAPAWPEAPASEWSVELLHGAGRPCSVKGGERVSLSLEQLPPAGAFRLRVRDPGEAVLWEGLRQAEWRGPGAPPFPAPTPMVSLVGWLTAMDAIPRCRAKGFSRPDDDLFQRLRAYLCSWRWDGSAGHPALERLKERIAQVRTYVAQGRRGGALVSMSREERGRLEELEELVRGLAP